MTLRRKLIWTENPFNDLLDQHKDGGWPRLVYRHLLWAVLCGRPAGM